MMLPSVVMVVAPLPLPLIIIIERRGKKVLVVFLSSVSSFDLASGKGELVVFFNPFPFCFFLIWWSFQWIASSSFKYVRVNCVSEYPTD